MHSLSLTFFPLFLPFLVLAAPGPQQATIKPVGKPTPVNPPPSVFSTSGAPVPGVLPFGIVPPPAQPTSGIKSDKTSEQVCASGTPMSDVIFWTTGAPSSLFQSDKAKEDVAIKNVIETVRQAVIASGGQVKHTYNMSSYKGLSIVVPTALLGLVEAAGSGLGFKTEPNGVVTALPIPPN